MSQFDQTNPVEQGGEPTQEDQGAQFTTGPTRETALSEAIDEALGGVTEEFGVAIIRDKDGLSYQSFRSSPDSMEDFDQHQQRRFVHISAERGDELSSVSVVLEITAIQEGDQFREFYDRTVASLQEAVPETENVRMGPISEWQMELLKPEGSYFTPDHEPPAVSGMIGDREMPRFKKYLKELEQKGITKVDISDSIGLSTYHEVLRAREEGREPELENILPYWAQDGDMRGYYKEKFDEVVEVMEADKHRKASSPEDFMAQLEKASHGDARARRRGIEALFQGVRTPSTNRSFAEMEGYAQAFEELGREDFALKARMAGLAKLEFQYGFNREQVTEVAKRVNTSDFEVLEASAGNHIVGMTETAVKMSEASGKPVVFKFNDGVVVARDGLSADELYKEWRARNERDSNPIAETLTADEVVAQLEAAAEARRQTERDYEQLPKVAKAWVTWMEGGNYGRQGDVGIAVDAAKVAEALKTQEAILDWANSKGDAQREKVEISDGHSGTSFAQVVRLAQRIVMTEPQPISLEMTEEQQQTTETPEHACAEFGESIGVDQAPGKTGVIDVAEVFGTKAVAIDKERFGSFLEEEGSSGQLLEQYQVHLAKEELQEVINQTPGDSFVILEEELEEGNQIRKGTRRASAIREMLDVPNEVPIFVPTEKQGVIAVYGDDRVEEIVPAPEKISVNE